MDLTDGTMHMMPVHDLVQHDIDEDCICGPTIKPIPQDDGTIDWMICHHALDGRK